MRPLKKVLENAGLNSNEALIYLTCLKLGTQNLNVISKESGLSKYDSVINLTSLSEKGFVTKFFNGKDFFTAVTPCVILKILNKNKEQMEKNIEKFQKSILLFSDYVNPSITKPKINYFEGKDGVISAYEDTLTSTTDIEAIASLDDTETYFPKYTPEYYQRRKAAGILIKAIFPDSPIARKRQLKDEEELRISRLLPRDYMDFRIEMNIYEDKVAYFSVKEKLAVIIKSKFISNSMRHMFRLCWKIAEDYDGKINLSNEIN